jgi:hypothetical protein
VWFILNMKRKFYKDIFFGNESTTATFWGLSSRNIASNRHAACVVFTMESWNRTYIRRLEMQPKFQQLLASYTNLEESHALFIWNIIRVEHDFSHDINCPVITWKQHQKVPGFGFIFKAIRTCCMKNLNIFGTRYYYIH